MADEGYIHPSRELSNTTNAHAISTARGNMTSGTDAMAKYITGRWEVQAAAHMRLVGFRLGSPMHQAAKCPRPMRDTLTPPRTPYQRFLEITSEDFVDSQLRLCS
jgi:hypothetical protein